MKNKKQDTEIVRTVYKKQRYSHDIFFTPSTRNRYRDYPNLQVLCDELSSSSVDDYDDVREVVKGYKE